MNKNSLLFVMKNLIVLYYTDDYGDDCIYQTIDRLIDKHDKTIINRYILEQREFVLTESEISDLLISLQPKEDKEFFSKFIKESFYVKLYVFIKRNL